MALELEIRQPQPVPVEVEGILPERTAPMGRPGIERLEIFVGNQRVALREILDLRGDPRDGRHVWQGDLRGVHWIGAAMTTGEIRIDGDVGRHLGSGMRGGRIDVFGNASDWVGAEMRGGCIHVRGNAGHLIGAAYRGSRRGMLGGTIMIDGDVGNEIGHTMRRGLLAVGGNAGDLIGFNMLAGTILVFGAVGIRHGAGMKRGTIGLWGEGPPPLLLPTFRYACRARPLALELVLRQLQADGFSVPERCHRGNWGLFHGDLLTGGRGEMLLNATTMPVESV